jgi:hypothetical protein
VQCRHSNNSNGDSHPSLLTVVEIFHFTYFLSRPHCILQHSETSSATVEKRPDPAIRWDEQELHSEKMDGKNQSDHKVKKISCCVRVNILKLLRCQFKWKQRAIIKLTKKLICAYQWKRIAVYFNFGVTGSWNYLCYVVRIPLPIVLMQLTTKSLANAMWLWPRSQSFGTVDLKLPLKQISAIPLQTNLFARNLGRLTMMFTDIYYMLVEQIPKRKHFRYHCTLS